MKFTRALAFVAISPCLAFAGSPDAIIEAAPTTSRWSFGFSFAPLLNVEADFSGLGAFSSPFAPQPLGGMQNYNYDDGFVRIDASDNAGGMTRYWGYDNASQYDAGAETLAFNLSNSQNTGKAGETEDLSPGFELTSYYSMGEIANIAGRPVKWGFKGGLQYVDINIRNSRSLTSDFLRVTDTYDTTGILIPGAGYEGTFLGPGGTLINDGPINRDTTLIVDGATITGSRDLDVDMLNFGFGPYIELPLSKRFSLTAEAGINFAVTHGEYEFESSTTIVGVGTQASSGDDDTTKILPGAYAGAGMMWHLTDYFSLQGSARYQYMDRFSVKANDSEASLTFDGAFVISVGGVFRF